MSDEVSQTADESRSDAKDARTEATVDERCAPPARRVMLTGATGFVGRQVLRELLLNGHSPVCVVRSRSRLDAASKGLDQRRISGVVGDIFDTGALRAAAEQSDAGIHLVGIIIEDRWRGQTFDRVHRTGTENVVDELGRAGVKRYVHMSALGTRREAVAMYHRTKFAAEEHVRRSGLDWTIFRPSVIHGWDGEFMQLMKRLACGLVPPVMPYFGTGEGRIQPVSVKDVASCVVGAVQRTETIGRTYSLGGPRTYTWKEFYAACRRLIPGAKRWKPLVSQPVPIAKLLARTVMRTPFVPGSLKFDVGQVQMSQEDSVCDVEEVESAFAFRLRDFEAELSRYGALIP